jgi:hypothetical protein
VEESFRRANYRLQVHYGFGLSAERIRAVTLAQAGELAAEQAGRKPVGRLPGEGAEAIATQCDGSMVRLVRTAAQGDRRKRRQLEWKEARVCAAQARGSCSIHYEGLLGSVEAAGIAWSHATAKAGWGVGSLIHPMGDGAVWIQQQAAVQFPGSAFLLDLYHVCEYLAEAAPRCAQKESPRRWSRRQKNKLRKGKAAQVIEELRAKSEPAQVPEELAPVRQAYRYLHTRADQLDYPGALRRDLPVGTGMIESAHKQIVQQRLKGPGMAWLAENADALIRARALRATAIQNQESLTSAAYPEFRSYEQICAKTRSRRCVSL